MIQLRDYQVEARETLRARIKAGARRQCLCLPTGAGKTEVAMDLIERTARNGKRAVFAADRRALIDQTSQRFFSAGIEHGVAMSDSTFGRLSPIQIVSQQTIEKRGYLPKCDLLIVDECHTTRDFMTKYITSKPEDVTVIGLSATPFTKGLGEIYDGGVVNAITTLDLMEKGWLINPTVYACTPIDISNIKKTSTGEFEAESAGQATIEIIGDIVDEWINNTYKEFGGPVKTLGFGPTVASCEAICARFREAGFDFRTSSYKDKEGVSEKLVQQFRNGEFIGLFSVDKFTKGLDVPDIMCLIAARTLRKSLTGHIQQVGRLIRPFTNKTKALLNCHSGNWKGFYEAVEEFWEEGIDELATGRKSKEATRKEKHEIEPPTCIECGIILSPGQKNCPGCGKERPKRQDKAIYIPGKMEKQEAIKKGSRKWRENKEWVWRNMMSYAGEMMNEYNSPKEKAVKFALAQYRQMYGEWPPYDWSREPIQVHQNGRYCDDRVRRAMRKQTNSYKKTQRKSWKAKPKKKPETITEAAVQKLQEQYGDHIVYRETEDEIPY